MKKIAFLTIVTIKSGDFTYNHPFYASDLYTEEQIKDALIKLNIMDEDMQITGMSTRNVNLIGNIDAFIAEA